MAAREISAGVKTFLGLGGLVRSITSLEALAALVSALLVHWRRTEKETEDVGFFQSSIRERRVGPNSSL